MDDLTRESETNIRYLGDIKNYNDTHEKDFRLVSPFKIPTLPTAFRVVYPPPKPISNPNPTFTYTSTLTQEWFVENFFDEGQKIKTEPLENKEIEEIDIKVKLEIEENI
jgi:hypothetical protein